MRLRIGGHRGEQHRVDHRTGRLDGDRAVVGVSACEPGEMRFAVGDIEDDVQVVRGEFNAVIAMHIAPGEDRALLGIEAGRVKRGGHVGEAP